MSGIKEGIRKTAKEMLNENIPIETIMKITKLTEEELLEIKNNNK